MSATAMRRLPFRLPEFSRVSWVSDEARLAWEPRIQRVLAMWLELEWQAVFAGVRRVALRVLADEELAAFGERAAAVGLALVPIDRVAVAPGYSSAGGGADAASPSHARVAVGRPEDAIEFLGAWQRGDQRAIGALLGYPRCCCRFFEDVWNGQGHVDTTWPMAARGSDAVAGTEVEVAGSPYANVLLRWLGVRAVPHLPCSFDCGATARLGRRLVALAREQGHAEEADLLLAMLDWPVEWSALHGIAEIKTPVLRISAATDATAERYVVRRPGGTYPDEGAGGLAFPYRRPERRRVTGSQAFRRGLEQAGGRHDGVRAQRWYHADNGFASRAAMDAAHQPVVALVTSVLGRTGAGSVVDLGCGNGALLEKIRRSCRGAAVRGIEADAAKAGRARELLGEGAVVRADMFGEAAWPADERVSVAVLMPGRLLEAAADDAARLRRWLAARCERIVVYVYSGYDSEHDGIASLAAAAGLVVEPTSVRSGTALASVAPDAPTTAVGG